MGSKAEQRSDAMKVLRNPEDHSKAEIAKAKKVLAQYDALQGGDMAVSVSIGVLPKSKNKMLKEQKTKMMRGGMANKKEHFYVGGGAVTDNAGLRALKASGPKGAEAYNKIMKNK